MIRFLKRLFRGGATPAAGFEAVQYNGFTIHPRPRERAGGWSTEALISKVVDGQSKEHAFIRADASSTKEGAAALTISKAKNLIDQRGDGIFSTQPPHTEEG